MDPLQAFHHLSQVIEQVNAILGSFIAKEVGNLKSEDNSKGESEQPIDELETHFYFSPEKKNVVFACSLDNWGFSVESFSTLIAKKLGKEKQ
jgi:ribosome assembly protein 1